MLSELKHDVCQANLRLVEAGLVVLTWGNASAFDSDEGLVVIKPSGLDYSMMRPEDMVVVDLSGKIVEGRWRPSSDTPTHLEIYKNFGGVRGVVHTHSFEATARAQAGKALPCLGTTHADCFHGEVPVTRQLTATEVSSDYELNTGVVIVEQFKSVDPLRVPGVLVRGHGPFAWGRTVQQAVDAAITLESVARLTRLTESISSSVESLPDYILEKHFQRKHGAGAYYGQGGAAR